MGKRQRRRIRQQRLAANPYLPAETNPFGQQENPFVPMNENIEQGVAPTEPEGPRVVTGPDTPETVKPRGDVTTVDASLDRLKVAVVCEGCGQRGLLRLGQVSDSTRCRCGSDRVELLEASRKTAASGWDSSTMPANTGSRDFSVEQVKRQIGTMNILSVSGGRVGTLTASNRVVGVELPVSSGYSVRVFLANDDTYTVQRVMSRAGTDKVKGERSGIYAFDLGETVYEAGMYKNVAFGSRRIVAEKECTCWEGYERVPGTEPCEKGSCRKKTSRRRTSMRWSKSLRNDYGHWTSEFLPALDGQGSVYAVVYKDMQSRQPYSWSVVRSIAGGGEPNGKAETLADAKRAALTAMEGFIKSSSRRVAAEGWMQSPNPHHYYKTVVKNGYELNLFASDVDYRWAVDAMVTGDSSSLELFEQGIGTSLEDAKRQAEQSAQFFQG